MKNNDNNNDHNKHRLKMLDLNEAPSSLWEETSTENNYEVLNDHGHGHGHDLGDGDDDWIRFKIAIINKKIAEKRKENEALKASIDELISTNQDLQTEIADEERRREQSLVSRESNFVSVETDTSISNNKRVATIPASVEAGECSTAREMPMKKGRVVVRTRTEENTMSDGCQWRKYGQKESKTNPNPRAYYRCGMGVNCPVRKQVQRCAEDKSILITTYEQKHNHKLPSPGIPIANVMSCVAEMSTTQSNVLPGLLGLSIFSQPTLLPGFPGLATISASPPFPTVILDLTIPQLQINNSPNGLDMVGLTQQLLGQTRSNEPNRENGNLLNDPTNTARALVASNPSSGPDRENGFAFK